MASIITLKSELAQRPGHDVLKLAMQLVVRAKKQRRVYKSSKLGLRWNAR